MPEYGETIKRLQTAAKKNVMPLPDLGNQDIADPQSLLAQGIIDRTQANEAAEERRKVRRNCFKLLFIAYLSLIEICRVTLPSLRSHLAVSRS